MEISRHIYTNSGPNMDDEQPLSFKASGADPQGGDIFDCKNIERFANSIVQILPFTGYSNSRFYICEANSVRFLAKTCFYRKTPPELYNKALKGVMAHADAEINILWALKQHIIDTNVSPCILEIVHSHICDTIKHIAPNDKSCAKYIKAEVDPQEDLYFWLCKYKEYVASGLAEDKCAFVVLEQCDISLDQFIGRFINNPAHYAIFRSILFMIIHAIWSIKRKFPGFHHFDLHTENIMLKFDHNYMFSTRDPKFLVLPALGKKYAVPYFGIKPKIIDFGFSSLPELGIISSATQDRIIMFERSENDLLFLFHWIHRTAASYSVGASIIDRLLVALEPTKSFIRYDTEHIRRVRAEIPSYDDMLSSQVFSDYVYDSLPAAQIYEEYSSVV